MAVHTSHILGNTRTKSRLGLYDRQYDVASLWEKDYSPRRAWALGTLSLGLHLSSFALVVASIWKLFLQVSTLLKNSGLYSTPSHQRSFLWPPHILRKALPQHHAHGSSKHSHHLMYYLFTCSLWVPIRLQNIVSSRRAGALFTTIYPAPNVWHVVKTNICWMNERVFSADLEIFMYLYHLVPGI